jgi:hypothetical protein
MKRLALARLPEAGLPSAQARVNEAVRGFLERVGR